MSKVVKGIGKVFKKIGKVVKKVLPIALAVGAVVFTGGAALGLPFAAGGFSGAVGGLVSSLGLSGAVGGALTGAITNAGFGAAIGGVLGGKKGMMKGMLAGATTGGLMGAVSPGTYGMAANAAPKLSAGDITITQPSGSGGLGAGLDAAKSSLTAPPPYNPPVTATPPIVDPTPPTATSGGLGGFIKQNPLLAGQMLTSVSSALGGSEYGEMSKAEKKKAKAAWGGAYSGSSDIFGTPNYGMPPPIASVEPSTRWAYDPSTFTLKEMKV